MIFVIVIIGLLMISRISTQAGQISKLRDLLQTQSGEIEDLKAEIEEGYEHDL